MTASDPDPWEFESVCAWRYHTRSRRRLIPVEFEGEERFFDPADAEELLSRKGLDVWGGEAEGFRVLYWVPAVGRVALLTYRAEGRSEYLRFLTDHEVIEFCAELLGDNRDRWPRVCRDVADRLNVAHPGAVGTPPSGSTAGGDANPTRTSKSSRAGGVGRDGQQPPAEELMGGRPDSGSTPDAAGPAERDLGDVARATLDILKATPPGIYPLGWQIVEALKEKGFDEIKEASWRRHHLPKLQTWGVRNRRADRQGRGGYYLNHEEYARRRQSDPAPVSVDLSTPRS